MPRRLALSLVALAALAAAACGDGSTVAIRVGDTEVSEEELLDDLEEFAGNPDFVRMETAAASGADGYTTDFVTIAVGDRVFRELNNAEFEARGLELDDSAREQARSILVGDEPGAGDALGAFSDEFSRQYVDDVARQLVLQRELGEQGYGAWLNEALTSADVEVASRFGSWDEATGRAVPPEGPATG